MRRRWTVEQLAELERRYPHERTATIALDLGHPLGSVHQKAYALGLHKSEAYLASTASGRTQPGHARGASTRFAKGCTPWNKGLHYVAGGRSAETRFKPGCKSARWDPEIYCVGALRVTTDGCLQIRVSDEPHPRGWMQMARYVWWSETGHWPTRDEVVRAKNGDPHDTRIENLELMTRGENARRNQMWTTMPRELASAIQLLGAVKRQINQRTRPHEQDDHGPARGAVRSARRPA